MLKIEDLEKLFRDRDALRAADWTDLHRLKTQFPFSNLVTTLLAKKAFLEGGGWNHEQVIASFRQSDNTGVTLSNLENFAEPAPPKPVKRPPKKNKAVKKADPKKTGIPPKKPEKPVKTIPADSIGKEKPDSYKHTGFTQWLLARDESVRPAEPEVRRNELTAPDAGGSLREEIISESLAEIYVNQGLIREAIQMYEKLSLKNPKKSAYFAQIIENLKKN